MMLSDGDPVKGLSLIPRFLASVFSFNFEGARKTSGKLLLS